MNEADADKYVGQYIEMIRVIEVRAVRLNLTMVEGDSCPYIN
jgi:hypothetical protein